MAENNLELDLGYAAVLKGLTAYQYAVSQGYTGTEEEYAAACEEMGVYGGEYLASVNNAAGAAKSANAAALQAAAAAAEVKQQVASPFVTAATAAAMTDHTKAYVYTGSESGYTHGGWYWWNGSAWALGGTAVDDTLLVSGAPADAKTAGDAVNELISSGAVNNVLLRGLADEAGHYYADGFNNDKTVNDSGSIESSKPGNAMTNALNAGTYQADAVEIPSAAYRFKLVGYSELPMNSSHYLGQTPFIAGGAGRLLFRKAEWPIFSVVVTRNPADTTSFTSAELSTLAGLINRYAYNDSAARLDAAEERTVMDIDTSELGYSYGGLLQSGKAYPYTTRLRLRPASGLAAFSVLAGSTITPNAGYKFNVAMYSSYSSNSKFELLDFASMRTTAYTIPYDCYIRIGIGATDDAELWSGSGSTIALTEAGAAAVTDALTLNLIGGTVKSEVENLKAAIGKGIRPIYTIDSIPLTAAAYHTLWDELMAEQPSIVRTKAGDITAGAETYPVYMYTIRTDMDHIAKNYNRTAWDGSNELYSRPKIFISSGIHGNERTTPVALFEFVKSLFNDPEYQAMKNAFDWYIVPLANPWGFSHTAYKDGVPQNNSTFDPATETAVENTSAVHNGIRTNADGIDANRDFGDFETGEANVMRAALAAATADGRDFVFAMDMHQAAKGNSVNAIGAFLSLSFGAPAADKDLIYGKWMQAGAVTELDMAEYTDRENVQSVFPWNGTENETLRNYLADYSRYATCFEGGQNCWYYSGTSEWSNPTAGAFISTQMHNFMKTLTGIWM